MPGSAAKVAIVATLDSKGAEVDYLCRQLEARGRGVVLLDIGTGGAPAVRPDFSRDDLRRAAEETSASQPAEHSAGAGPGAAMTRTADGARLTLARLFAEGRLRAVLGVGGGKGSAAFSTAVANLPFGFPKILVTSARAAMIGEIAARSDVILMPTLVDLFGVNSMTELVLVHAASVAATLEYRVEEMRERTSVAITAFGVTTPAVQAIKAGLEALGLEVITFPANGVGGQLMERMIRQGTFAAIVDLTTTELADLHLGGTASAGAERLTAAAETGVPQLVAPGAVDMVNFGAKDTVPPAFNNRTFYQHTPFTTLMRTTPEETAEIGRMTARRLAGAKAPVAVFWPQGGVSDYDRPGQPFHDPVASRAWRDAAFAALPSTIETRDIHSHINDPAFAEACVDWVAKALDLHT